ncbi:hypothetical protein CH380_02950 [Leptospira adleri]|uniref:Uncharacterized protein n=1 Tax=Leptospira adleri TaxID=2023186 RepID=A0A2M9YT42_9LEPT|nr:hypothetical protein CH380_02950 [Leptospira adleri]PJZ60817.1 hypothetical protein CH376_16330 [Leptospira adleri]
MGGGGGTREKSGKISYHKKVDQTIQFWSSKVRRNSHKTFLPFNRSRLVPNSFFDFSNPEFLKTSSLDKSVGTLTKFSSLKTLTAFLARNRFYDFPKKLRRAFPFFSHSY